MCLGIDEQGKNYEKEWFPSDHCPGSDLVDHGIWPQVKLDRPQALAFGSLSWWGHGVGVLAMACCGPQALACLIIFGPGFTSSQAWCH